MDDKERLQAVAKALHLEAPQEDGYIHRETVLAYLGKLTQRPIPWPDNSKFAAEIVRHAVDAYYDAREVARKLIEGE